MDRELAVREVAKTLGIPFSDARIWTRDIPRQMKEETLVLLCFGEKRQDISMEKLLSQKAFAACAMKACGIIPKQLPTKLWLEWAQYILDIARSAK